ncbi:hypothetical protein CMUS01_14136 [Colletotrichum musicola]|uniref:Uncharacterized protein n=1 Tax=Colletotrichum musicola TaxID=2175873 RepID=A0A8H6J6Q3_9PEZI|nr:hypothetical protein CMUS01_14136 [Colletotrichum musicola]
MPSSNPKPKQPKKAKNPAPRPVKPSIRHNRSAFEYSDDELSQPMPTPGGSQSTQECIVVGGPPAPKRPRRGGRKATDGSAPPPSTAPAALR